MNRKKSISNTKISLRRPSFGCLWLIVLWFLTLMLGVIIISGLKGEKASDKYSEDYTDIIFATSVLLSITGTVAGVFPGTRPMKKCPHCAEYIKTDAQLCKHCHEPIES